MCGGTTTWRSRSSIHRPSSICSGRNESDDSNISNDRGVFSVMRIVVAVVNAIVVVLSLTIVLMYVCYVSTPQVLGLPMKIPTFVVS